MACPWDIENCSHGASLNGLDFCTHGFREGMVEIPI